MDLMQIRRVAKILDVSPKRVYALIQEGRLEAVKLGPHLTRIPRASLEAFLAEAARRAAEDRPVPPVNPRRRKRRA
ncbi:MAG: hypothetical protein Kow0059_22190 [Candidatus Sumerlaeia bacterium]